MFRQVAVWTIIGACGAVCLLAALALVAFGLGLLYIFGAMIAAVF